jgi:hypothetical protein
VAHVVPAFVRESRKHPSRREPWAQAAHSGLARAKLGAIAMLTRSASTLVLFVPLAFAAACTMEAATGGGSGGRTSGGGGSSHTGGSSTGGQDAGGDATDGSIAVSCSGASPSFANDVHPVLQGCAGELCHGDIGPAWPYQRLVNVPVSRDTCDPSALIVKPGSIDESYLMHKLTGIGMCPGTSPMPSRGNLLPSQQIQTIADWICQGAMNN